MMAYTYTPQTRLDRLKYSPTENPLIEQTNVKTRNRWVRSGRAEMLTSIETGEIKHATMIHQIEETDEAHFVKIFEAGIVAMFGLSRTAHKVFNLVLKRYQATDIAGGYNDCIDLFWFDNKLDGQSIGITEQTFKKGLRELLDKQFLWPRMPHSYWVNPNLFFKGNRVLFIKEYRLKRQHKPSTNPIRDQHTVDFINGQPNKEQIK